jgi:serine/threonine-protein kinase
MPDWPFAPDPAAAPPDYLAGVGEIFAVFDARTQDSGNVSFGVAAAGARWFVKTAGAPQAKAFHAHPERLALLEGARAVSAALEHPARPRFWRTLPSAWGPMLVYDWAEGELIGGPAERRADPASGHQRFRRLPVAELTAALDAVLDVHARLAASGFVACDFYDGAMLYDFQARRLTLVDLDHYRRGAFVNRMGRMFGSTRFMGVGGVRQRRDHRRAHHRLHARSHALGIPRRRHARAISVPRNRRAARGDAPRLLRGAGGAVPQRRRIARRVARLIEGPASGAFTAPARFRW